MSKITIKDRKNINIDNLNSITQRFLLFTLIKL